MNIYTISLYALLCTCLFGLALQARLRHRRWCEVRAAEAYRWCSTMLKLLMSMQLHRGMANTYLNGDISFERRMLERRTEIQALLVQIDALPGHPVREIAGFDEINIRRWVQDWEDLSDRLTTYSATESMARHTALIASLLVWLRGMGESGLTVASASNDKQRMRSIVLFCDRLPVLAETLGCARGLGAGVAASGAVTAVARTRLRYLANRIDALLQDVRSSMPTSGKALKNAPATGARLQQCMHEVDSRVGMFLDTLQNDMIACEKSRVSAGSYFASATAAIESVFTVTDLLGEQLAPETVRPNTAAQGRRHDTARAKRTDAHVSYPSNPGLVVQE